jgi:hypothetical protein
MMHSVEALKPPTSVPLPNHMSRIAPAQADAAYAALPQAPDAAYAGHPVVPTAFGGDDDIDHDGEVVPSTTLYLDARIRWIMFMLGAAVLLPWNGEYSVVRGTHKPI